MDQRQEKGALVETILQTNQTQMQLGPLQLPTVPGVLEVAQPGGSFPLVRWREIAERYRCR